MLISFKDTLAARLGTTTHMSGLLIKARRLGLVSVRELSTLGVQRGCKPYAQGDEPSDELVLRDKFSDEELTLSLLNIALPYDKRCILIGAAMLGSKGNSVDGILRLTKWERSEPVVRYVAECGHHFEPDNSFWNSLLTRLPHSVPKHGVLPEPTEFLATSSSDPQSAVNERWVRAIPQSSQQN